MNYFSEDKRPEHGGGFDSEFVFNEFNCYCEDFSKPFHINNCLFRKRKINKLRSEVKRWLNIQSMMTEYWRSKLYLSHIRIIHNELDRLDQALSDLGTGYPYREGQNSRRIIIQPKKITQ